MHVATHSTRRSFLRFFMYLAFFLVALPLLTSCESRKTIVNSLDEKEANEILVFLGNKGIDVAKVQTEAAAGGGGSKLILFDITVPEKESRDAMNLLNQAGLPRRRGQSLLGLFGTVGLVPSEMQEKIRYQAGLAEQIASTIRKIDGILDAEVQISFPEEDPLNPGIKKPIVSSVYVKHSGVLDDPNTHLVTKIKRLVSASVAGLDFDNVTVIGDRARFSETSGGGFQGQGEDEKPLITVWSIIIAQESLTRFRLIFFGFTILSLLLLMSLLWMGWKVYPLLKNHGGIKQLFQITPVNAEKKAEAADAEEKTVTTAAKEALEQTKPTERDVDET